VLEERDLGSLRWAKFGGEPFPPKHLRALQRLMPNARFSNVYGPAEVNQCTVYHVPTLADDEDAPLPIGTIWPNAEGLVVDADDAPVAAGESGELLVRTPTMMQGYWNRPDLNTRAFYHRPGAGGTTDRFYRTGDVVQERPDGLLDFLGRIDRQVKTRGYRVELDEVEAALLTHEAVAETAVFPVPDTSGTQRIEAAVIPSEGTAVTEAELRRHLAPRLPAYAHPVTIAVVDTLPRTSNGKIDRLALQASATETPASA
jgi:acyl-coenzyme A synthetase/AMP-(fatty) acid ligase